MDVAIAASVAIVVFGVSGYFTTKILRKLGLVFSVAIGAFTYFKMLGI